ncbi:Crp/Fnr family transcriptional regulator [Hymenobacter sp. DH14]|uniref:Crp/Fnr family transcriptional regulator n=1 Tax=Hymenobacter cyanobacteriorum TaxID=2926463 RepID=A0A9X1VDU5_9BACT|nr:Crp/Fnr family transcriptional regulator [Hymenobacter cyanobacteriorum]MCI1187349.1 Crp/Fnr family transcriptional regulator [Hymenobacter cyanobacteriorum]
MSNVLLQQFLQSTGAISAAQAAEIATCFQPRKIARHQLLLEAGQVSDTYFFLTQGLLRAFALDPDGTEVTTGLAGPGQVVFEVASFFNRTPSLEYIQALTDCEGWCLSYRQLNELFHARPEFREFGRGILVRGFAALKARMLATITESASARYDKLLRAHPELLLHVPLKYIASYLGITDSSLSRIRKADGKK